MNIGWSTISTLSDPSMLVAESGVIIGLESLISGHTIINDKLYLKKIILKKGCLIGARCILAPGVYVGEGAVIHGQTDLLPGARIPQGAVIGKGSTITAGMSLKEDTTYPWFMQPAPKQS
ncbi:MAG: hypothetical protein IPK04_22005 [Bdellovibrionales bacterium]|nr:hypothetical protein [Bdellovibrionales bacterium]